MTFDLIDPEDLHKPDSYTQVIAATGSRLVDYDDIRSRVIGAVGEPASAYDAGFRAGFAHLWMGSDPVGLQRTCALVVAGARSCQ
jgi:predicted hydrocarbon binding protein